MKHLICVIGLPEVEAALRVYDGVNLMTGRTHEMVSTLLGGSQPVDAVVLDDSRSTLPELWATITLCRQHHVGVYLLLYGLGRERALEFQDAGCAVCTGTDEAAILPWLERELTLRQRTLTTQLHLAVASGKGGVGKSELMASLGAAAQARGVATVIADCDVANGSVRGQFGFTTEPSFLRVTRDAQLTGTLTRHTLAPYIHPHPATGLHVLLAPESTTSDPDVPLADWKVAMRVLREHPFDLVLIDTPPEIVRRPYAWATLQAGGAALIPLPPGKRERTGAATFLHWVKSQDPALLERCFLVQIEPERGSVARGFLDTITQAALREYPGTRLVGRIPRDAKLLSLVSESEGPYQSPLQLAPASRYAQAIHGMLDTMGQQLGLSLPLPAPRSSWWARLTQRPQPVLAPDRA